MSDFESLFDWLGQQGCLDHVSENVVEPEEKPEQVLHIDFPKLESIMKKEGNYPFDLSPEVLEELEEKGDKPLSIPANFEVLAWYQPIHYFGHAWGIYIKESAVIDLAARIYQPLFKHSAPSQMTYPMSALTPSRAAAESIYAAIMILYLHEEYHHKVESFSVRNHIVTERCSYDAYKKNVYQPARSSTPTSCREEAMCHAYSRRKLRSKLSGKASPNTIHQAISVVDEIITQAVGPYAGADFLISDSDFEWTQSELQCQIQEGIPITVTDNLRWQHEEKLFSPLYRGKNLPCILVPITTPLIRVPGVLQFTATSRGVVKVIRKHGYQEEKGGKGSHTKYGKAGGPMIIIPKGKELSPGVLKSVAQSLGMPIQDLAKQAR